MSQTIYAATIDANTDPYIRKVAQMQAITDKATSRIDSSFKKIGAGIVAYFSGREMLNFAGDAVQLATKLSGVKAAFDKLGNSKRTLDMLRAATQGTVSDLQLMQAAVKANNFKLPLELLGKGLEFANKRAIQTGESVDYMVESFITGVARKSIPILDNLGISQLSLNSEIEKTGDFYSAIGNIVEAENNKMSSAIDRTVLAQSRLKASIENNEAEMGKKLLPIYDKILSASNSILNDWTVLFRLFDPYAFAKARMTQQFDNLNQVKGYITNTYSGSSITGTTNSNNVLNSDIVTNKGKTIPMIGSRKMDNPLAYLNAVMGNAGARGGETPASTLFSGFTAEMTSKAIPEFKMEFETIGLSFVEKFSETQNIAGNIARIFNVSADSFVGKLMQAFDVGSSILSIIGSIASLAGSPLGFLGLAKGGTVINNGGQLSYAPIPKFAHGGSYVVPPGYSNDSGLIRVQSGERVDVTPSGQVPMISKMLQQINNSIQAGNINTMKRKSQPMIIKLSLDGHELGRAVTAEQNRMIKSGVNMNELQ